MGQHVHASALFAINTFILILLLGTLWRTITAKVGRSNPAAAGAMATQF